MLLPIPLRNPAYVRTYPVLKDPEAPGTQDLHEALGKALDRAFSRRDDGSWSVEDGILLRLHTKRLFDTDILELWVVTSSDDANPDGTGFVAFARAVLDRLSLPPWKDWALPPSDFLLTPTDCSAAVRYADPLAYGLAHKRLDRVHIVFSREDDPEYLGNAFKNIELIAAYSEKIERFHERFLRHAYPEMLRMHTDIVADCQKLLREEGSDRFDESALARLNQEVLRLDSLNFGLSYDIESIESNAENLASRIESIGAGESRYFDNFLRKARATLASYEKAVAKNTLVKDTILQNAKRTAERETELRRARLDRDKVDHIKNIKELLGGFAFIEIFINGLAQAAVVFSFPEGLRDILQSTDMLRMLLLCVFVVAYFARFLWQRSGAR